MTSDTHQRILDVSAELFIEQGYDATSLREIADRLGFTKAALYYHFQSKDEILKALVAPASEIIEELMRRLEAAADVREWADTLEWVIDRFYDNIRTIQLMEKNHHVLEQLAFGVFDASQHQHMHERVEAAASAASSSTKEEIRMIAALGAVTGFDDWAPTLLARTPADVLRGELSATVRDILGLRAPRRRKAALAPA